MTVSTHPAPEQLLQFVRGQLRGEVAEEIISHLELCPACEQLVSQVPPDSFVSKIRKAQSLNPSFAQEPNTPHHLSTHSNAAPRARSQDSDELPSELINHERYNFLRKLGGGGMGVVYLAEHKLMKRKVAIKLMPPSLAEHPAAVDRFLNEIVACAALEHQNIVRAYSAERCGPHILFEMEYVDGQDLSELVQKKGSLPVRYALNYVKQAAIGLQHAHNQKLVHRDIKPRNILLTRQGQIKVADFGLAKFQFEFGEDPGGNSLTGDNKMMGTPDYMAPEQSRNARTADIRADIYSLGCTLYFLLTGKTPYVGQTLMEVIFAHSEQPTPDVCTEVPTIPAEVSQLVKTMMAKLPSNRPQTPQAVIDQIRRIEQQWSDNPKSTTLPDPFEGLGLDDTEPIARTVSTISSPSIRSWYGSVLALLVFLCVVFVGGWASGIIRLRTPEGTIELSGYGPDVDVVVDGQKMLVEWDSGKKKAEIKVAAGKSHKLELIRDGETIRTESFELIEFGRRVFDAKLLANRPIQTAPKPSQQPTDSSILPRFPYQISGEKLSDWKIVGDELWQTSLVGKDKILFGDPNWTDYDFTTDMMLTQGNHAGSVLVRVEGLRDEISYTLASFANTWHMVGSILNGHLERPWLAAGEDQITVGKWYTVKISVRGKDGRVYRNGLKEFDFDASKHPQGMVGLGTWEAAYRFRNIKVTDPKGKVLLEGLPEVPKATPKTFAIQDEYAAVGEWQAEGAELVQASDKAIEFVHFGKSEWRDIDYSVEVKRVKGNEAASLLFNYQDRYNFSTVGFGSWGNTWHEMGTYKDGVFQQDHAVSVEGALTNNQWHHCKVSIRGLNVAAFLDGKKILEYKLDKPLSGSIGISSYLSVFHFRNITVTAPDGTTLLEGLPKSTDIREKEVHPDIARFPAKTDDFVAPEWLIDGQEVIQRSLHAHAITAIGDPICDEFDFSAEVNRVAGHVAGGLVFNYLDRKQHTWFELGAYGNKYHCFWKLIDGTAITEDAWSAVGSIENNTWYTMKVSVRRDQVQCYLNGEQILVIPLDKPHQGRIGLLTHKSSYRFRNIKVTTPNGTVLLEGFAAAPSAKTK